MKYPHELVGWLYEVASGLGWQVPILDILNTEKEYPGLMDDIAVEYWQRNLIKGQMEGTGQLGKRADSEIDGQGER
jgi:hypothetical protein